MEVKRCRRTKLEGNQKKQKIKKKVGNWKKKEIGKFRKLEKVGKWKKKEIGKVGNRKKYEIRKKVRIKKGKRLLTNIFFSLYKIVFFCPSPPPPHSFSIVYKN